MTIEYASEKLYLAVRELASSGTLAERLEIAFNRHLMHIQRADLPEDLWANFIEIRKSLTFAEPKYNEGSIDTSIRRRLNRTLIPISQKIVDCIRM